MVVIYYIVYQVRYIYHKPWNSATSKAAERYRLGASSCALERWFFCRMDIGSYPNSSHVRSPVAFTFTWRRTKRAKRNAKRGRRKCVPVDPLVLAMWRVFGGPFCSHVSEQKHRFWDCSRHCVQSVSLAIPISYLLTSCMISISRFFPKCSGHAMCVLFINAVMLYNDACWSRLHEDSSDVLDLTVDVVLCDKCSSLNLFLWYDNMIWSRYVWFTLSKIWSLYVCWERETQCNANTLLLSGGVVRSGASQTAHAIARERCVLWSKLSLWRKTQVDYFGQPHCSGYIFFRPLNEHFVAICFKKNWRASLTSPYYSNHFLSLNMFVIFSNGGKTIS